MPEGWSGGSVQTREIVAEMETNLHRNEGDERDGKQENGGSALIGLKS
jgi:hypothetical protein